MRWRFAFARHSREGGAFNSRRLVIQFLLWIVIPAEAGIQCLCSFARHSSASWNPAFAVDSAL